MLQHESAARKRRNGILLAAAYYDTKCQQIPDSAAAIVQSLQYRYQWSRGNNSSKMTSVVWSYYGSSIKNRDSSPRTISRHLVPYSNL